MGADVFVMPISRFKIGDFETPLQQAFGLDAVRVIDPYGQEVASADNSSNLFGKLYNKWKAKRSVAEIRRQIKKVNGPIPKWDEFAECVYSEQSFGTEAVRAFAKWIYLGNTAATFAVPEEGDYYKHSAWQAGSNDRVKRSHLIRNGCCNDYIVPARFEHCVEVDSYKILGRHDATRCVSSSQRIQEELVNLKDEFKKLSRNDFEPVLDGYELLKEVIHLSVTRNLPVVFWG